MLRKRGFLVEQGSSWADPTKALSVLDLFSEVQTPATFGVYVNIIITSFIYL